MANPSKLIQELANLIQLQVGLLDAHVLQSKRLRDPTIGLQREVDIIIEKQLGGYSFVVGVECFDYLTHLNVSRIEMIYEKHRSLSIDRTIVISRSGFTQAALIKAQMYHIQTLKVEEALKVDWSKCVSNHLAEKQAEQSLLRQNRLNVFLCHSSGDKQAVRDLYQRLRKDEFNPWLDEENLLPGQEWDQEIRKAVRNSHVVIVCLSQAAINKTGYVQKEIKFALDVADEQPEGTIFLIPVKLEECDVPERLRRWQWVNLFENKGYLRLLAALRHRAVSLGIATITENEISSVTKRVGLFIDFENLSRIIPPEVTPYDAMVSLRHFASHFGTIVSSWVSADMRSLSYSKLKPQSLEDAGFNVSTPRAELRHKGSAVDFILLERITDAMNHSQPNVYIIVTGDSDYYERITGLLELQYTVHLVASKKNLSSIYRELFEQRKKSQSNNEPAFFIDDLDEILKSQGMQSESG